MTTPLPTSFNRKPQACAGARTPSPNRRACLRRAVKRHKEHSP